MLTAVSMIAISSARKKPIDWSSTISNDQMTTSADGTSVSRPNVSTVNGSSSRIISGHSSAFRSDRTTTVATAARKLGTSTPPSTRLAIHSTSACTSTSTSMRAAKPAKRW